MHPPVVEVQEMCKPGVLVLEGPSVDLGRVSCKDDFHALPEARRWGRSIRTKVRRKLETREGKW